MRMMAVPGRPKSMDKAPNRSTRMKMVSPPTSRGDKLFLPLQSGWFDPFKQKHDRARDENGGIDAGNRSHEKRKGKIVDHAPSEKKQDKQDHEYREGGQQCSTEGLVDARIDDVETGLAAVFACVFAHPV